MGEFGSPGLTDLRHRGGRSGVRTCGMGSPKMRTLAPPQFAAPGGTRRRRRPSVDTPPHGNGLGCRANGYGQRMETSDSPDRDESTAVPPRDPLRKSVLSQTWVALTSFALVLVLIIDFVAQNTNSVLLSFLFWDWRVPLAVALLVAVAGGILITSLAGTVRIVQLRLRVRKDRRARP